MRRGACERIAPAPIRAPDGEGSGLVVSGWDPKSLRGNRARELQGLKPRRMAYLAPGLEDPAS